MKPSQYTDLRVISAETTYMAHAGLSDGTQTTSGILEAGRCVWIEHSPEAPQSAALIRAYVEGIGIISLDLRSVYPGRTGTA